MATGDVHYHRRERHRLHDVLVAIRHRSTLDGSHAVRRANSEFALRPPDEVAALFPDRPDAIARAQEIAERCRAFDLTRDLGYGFPDFRGAGRAPGFGPLQITLEGSVRRVSGGGSGDPGAEVRAPLFLDAHELRPVFRVHHAEHHALGLDALDHEGARAFR